MLPVTQLEERGEGGKREREARVVMDAVKIGCH